MAGFVLRTVSLLAGCSGGQYLRSYTVRMDGDAGQEALIRNSAVGLATPFQGFIPPADW